MGLFAKGSQELRRTCTRCGNVWYISRSESKERAPNGITVAGLKMKSAGNRGKLIGGKKKAIVAEQRIARAQAQRERVESFGRCSSCGSRQYREERA